MSEIKAQNTQSSNTFHSKLEAEATAVIFSQETQTAPGTSNASGAPLAYTELWWIQFQMWNL